MPESILRFKNKIYRNANPFQKKELKYLEEVLSELAPKIIETKVFKSYVLARNWYGDGTFTDLDSLMEEISENKLSIEIEE